MSVVELRNRFDLTQERFAYMIGAASTSISRWERGLCEPVGIHKVALELLEKALNRGHAPEQISSALIAAYADDEARMAALVNLAGGEPEPAGTVTQEKSAPD